MPLRVYNTLTREKEVFEPVTPGKVGMYLCGPTVYKSPHIGHMVGPVIFDAIKRYLTHKGYAVTWVVNVTDVDDKLIDKAQQTHSSVAAVAQKYEAEYRAALASLAIKSIDHFPRASEHMGEIVAITQTLVDKGNAYADDGNVWFDVEKDDEYGKLSGRRTDEQEAGLRTLAGSGKRSPADFALWKAAKPGEPAWDSPWGKGRPGWHIECTAMAIKFLGETFDIHGGGLDLIFPHHENELAQSECCTGKTFAKYWLHNGLTKIRTKGKSGEWKDEKMAGSVGNVVAVSDFVSQHGADVLRYLILSSHYRRPIEFSDEAVVVTKKAIGVFERLFDRVERLGIELNAGDAAEPAKGEPSAGEAPAGNAGGSGKELLPAINALQRKLLDAMDDDFNTAGAIGVLHEMAGEINGFIERSGVEKGTAAAITGSTNAEAAAAATTPSTAAAAPTAAASEASKTSGASGAKNTLGRAVSTLRHLGRLMGLFTVESAPAAAASDDGLTDGLMRLIIRLRAQARQKKDFPTADAIRDGLAELNVTIEDRAGETGWRWNSERG